MLDDATSCLFSFHHYTQCKYNHKINVKEKLHKTNGMPSFAYISQMYKKKKRTKDKQQIFSWVTYMQCSTQKVILAIVILKVVKISDTFVIWCWEKLKTLLSKLPWQLLGCMELWWGVRNQSCLLLEVLLLCLDRCFTCLEHYIGKTEEK